MIKPGFSFYCGPVSGGQHALFTKAAEGLLKHGITAKIVRFPMTKNIACWGWRKGQQLQAHGHNVLVFERAYLGDRFHWTSIAWNGLNGYGDFCLPEKITPDRFNKYYELKPWKPDGDKIIIMGQIPGDMSLQGMDLTEFYETKAVELQIKYNKPVYFRPHPAGFLKGRNFYPKIAHLEGSLEDALNNAFLVVTFNSNAGVDAVVNGVPALSFDAGSMAYEVTGHKITDRIKPDREEWAYKLAHCQWSPEEIAKGEYWERMKCKLES